MTRIVVITSEFPPDRGGVADYSARWISEMASHWEGCEVMVLEQTRWGFGGLLSFVRGLRRADPDVALLHYVPHMYNAKGLPLAMPFYALVLRRVVPNVVVLMHEIAVDMLSLRTRVMHSIQIGIAWMLVGCSTTSIVTTSGRLRWIRSVRGVDSPKVRFIPISPSLPLPELGRATASGNGPLSLLYFGSQHPSRNFDLVAAAMDALDDASIKYELRVIGTVEAPDPRVTIMGYLPDADVLEQLSQRDIALLPLHDGASSRRTTVANCLAAGVATVSTRGSDTDESFFSDALVLTDADASYSSAVLRLARDPGERARLGNAAAVWAESTISWAAVEPQWLRALGLA